MSLTVVWQYLHSWLYRAGTIMDISLTSTCWLKTYKSFVYAYLHFVLFLFTECVNWRSINIIIWYEMTKPAASNISSGCSVSETLFFISLIFSTVLLVLITLRSTHHRTADLIVMSYHVWGKLARTLVNKMSEDEDDINSTHEQVL